MHISHYRDVICYFNLLKDLQSERRHMEYDYGHFIGSRKCYSRQIIVLYAYASSNIAHSLLVRVKII